MGNSENKTPSPDAVKADVDCFRRHDCRLAGDHSMAVSRRVETGGRSRFSIMTWLAFSHRIQAD
jgi:hypothetical protein